MAPLTSGMARNVTTGKNGSGLTCREVLPSNIKLTLLTSKPDGCFLSRYWLYGSSQEIPFRGKQFHWFKRKPYLTDLSPTFSLATDTQQPEEPERPFTDYFHQPGVDTNRLLPVLSLLPCTC